MARTGSKKNNIFDFFSQVKSEARKVTWPSRKETTASVISVFFMVILAAIFLYLSDQLIAWLIRLVMGLGMNG